MSDICPSCGLPEKDAFTPRTVYECGSSDYDQRPLTFIQSVECELRQENAALKTLDQSSQEVSDE